jgi:hypothetical protein
MEHELRTIHLSNEAVGHQVDAMNRFLDMNDMQDTELAITGASLIEISLKETLVEICHDHPGDLNHRNLQRLPFAQVINFSAKQKIFTEIIVCEMNIIRRIRNEFAHEFRRLKFDTDKMSSMCNELKMRTQEDLLKECSFINFPGSTNTTAPNSWFSSVSDSEGRIFAGIRNLFEDTVVERGLFKNSVAMLFMILSLRRLQALIGDAAAGR